MSKERVSIYKAAKLREKKKAPERASAYLATKQNRGSDVGYVAKRAGTDFLRVGEGVVDAALVPIDLLTGNVEQAKSRFMDSPVDDMRERLDERYNPGKGMQFVGDIAGGIGQSVGYGLISAIPYAGKPMMYSSIVEQGISSAAEKTGKVGLKEVGYGATVGAIEGTLESKLGAGVNAAKGIGSAILKKTGINVAESAAKAGGKSLLKTLAIDTAKGFAGEFGEEFFSEAVDPKLQNIWGIDKDARFSFKYSFRAGIVGGISGGAISIGPSAINYKTAVRVGRALQESRLDGDLINRAKYTLSALEAAQARSTSQIKGKPEGDTKETAKEWLSRTSENRKVKRLSRETKELADKVSRNIRAYETAMADPAMAKANSTAAILGELRGNLFLVGYAYEDDVIEQVMMEATDEQRQAFVDAINEELAKQGKKHDYTLADFDANKDDIRRGLAGLLMADELQGNTAEYGAEAIKKPAQTATSPWDGIADNEDMSGYKAAGEAENALLKAAVNQSVPRGSVQAMLDEYRKGTDLTPEEFADGWSDGVHLIGRYGLKVDETAESAYNRLPQSAREASTRIGKETAETERKAAEEKAKAKKKPAAQAGKKGTVVRGEGLNIQKLSDEQYAAYKGAEVLAEVLGTDIVIENSIEERGHTVNGYFDPKTNRIHININALRNGKNIALYTLGHEVTHYIKEWSPRKFEALADFVLEQMGVDAETAIADKLASLKRLGIVTDTMTVAEANALAREELVAEGMELVLTDGKVLEELTHTDRSLWQEVKAWIQNIISKIRKYYGELNQASKTAQVLKETVESLDEIERLFTEGVTEAGERTRTAEAGVIVDDASGTAMLSVDDIPKTEKEIDDAVDRLVKKLGVDEFRARKWVEDEISLATLILRDDMVEHAHRKADRRLTAIVKNSDYKQGTLDFSNICRKRREYTRMMQRIQQAFPNRRFTAEEFATIRKIMVDERLEVACGLCYVEDRRQNEGYIAETFQRAVEAWRKGNRDTYYDTKNTVESAYNKGQAKAMAMLEGGDYVPTIADLTTVEGMNKLQAEHKDILQAWKAFNNARGMSSARLLTNEAEYQRQILKYKKDQVKRINDLGGLRVFSFSDFEEFHLLDIIQAVQDCAAMGIKIQFYTKVPSFALLMKDTKAKGNLSLIPLGDLGYEMKNGKRVLVYDPVEGIDFNDPAFKKVARGNPNIGTILVGINDDHIRTAMKDDFIDYIIPFHTGQTEVVRQIKKIGKWQNYKNEQVDKPWDSDSKAKPVNVYTDVIAAAEREGDPIRNERQFVERFLKVCEERGLRPRFSRFLNTNAEGKYVYTKGYYKLLLDFKMFDKDGTYLPQEAVIPEFEADLLHELTEKYVAGEKAKTEAESPAFQRALERVKAEVVGDDKGRMYSIDETPETPDVSNYDATLMSPWDVEPINRITSKKMFDYLASEFEANGYNGRPIVVLDGQAITGSHRIMAAREAEIDIPAVEISVKESNPLYEELLNARDDSQRARVAKELYDEGTITKEAYDLITREDELNEENWGREPEDTIRYSIDETPETPDVSNSAFDEALRRAGLSHLVEDTAEAETTETAPPPRKSPERDPEEVRLDRIRAHETLANALMEAAQNEHEFRLVKNYREKAAELAEAEVRKEELRKKTAEVNREIDALQSKLKGIDKTKREPWVMTALTDAQKRKSELLDEMDALDEKIRAETDKLLSLASAKQLRKMFRAERSKAAAMERSAERARQREMDSKEWAKETVKKAREESEEKVKKARQEAQDYKAAIYEKSMERVYKAKRESREYKNAVYRKAYEKAGEKVKAYREYVDRKTGESKERGEITARKRTVMRELGSLETKLYHPTKTNHVPKELHDLAMKTLSAADPGAFSANRANIKEMGDLTASIERLERKAMRTAKEQETLDGMKAKYEHLEEETLPLKKQAEAMLTAFVEYNENAPEALQMQKGVLNIMSNRVAEIEDAPLSQMGLRSLEAVETFVGMLSHQIKTANELFTQQRGEKISDWGNTSSAEAAASKPLKLLSPQEMEIKGMQTVREFIWRNMKPLTVFEVIGSPKFMELFKAVLDGEDVWITDVLEAREAILNAKETYKYDTWDLTTRREFTNGEGKTVRLTVGEMLSLYAYAKREQAKSHLRGGGFVLEARATEITEKNKIRIEKALNSSERYTMTDEDLGKLEGLLTAEQKKFAETMQDYLTSLGEKGNEVSRALYGIDLFNEEHYFPIKVKSEYLESQTGKTGDPKIKNRGYTKETVPDANNPLVLQDFMSVVSGHVNDMATYHAFVLPVEDLTRVLNYKPSNVIIDEQGNWTENTERKDYSTLKAVIENKYGAQANAYIEQLIRDLNGGARREAATNIIDKGITAFKRASTMASLSVLVQQPTSLFRAMAYIDPKHFRSLAALEIKGHKEAWEQIKKYAKVAAIKEMGGYDTGVGTLTADFINSREYKTWGDRAKAFFLPSVYGGDANYRAEVFGKGAAYADELAWIQMFDACKREQAEALGKSMDSEEVLTAAGKRFTEVVRRTQVYDSTLTRSENMRSKDTGMKMATAFMAEPTTVVSMMLDGLIRAQRGDKAFLGKTAGAIAASVIFNAMAASLVYAARDDDEEKTYTEKYLATLATETAEGFNPLEYLPYTRDIMSLMKGYDIERTDMALFADLFKSFERITSSTRTPAEKTTEVAGAVASFFGVPIKNLVRDAKIPVNIVQGSMSGERTTGKGISAALADEFSTITDLFGADTTNATQLYKAAVREDTDHYERVKARYKTPQAAEMALRTALRENDRRIADAAEAKLAGELEVYESIVEQIESEGHFDRGIVIRAVNNEILDIKDEDTSKLVPKDETVTDEEDETAESLYKASDLNNALERGDTEDFAAIMYALVQDKVSTGKTEAQAKASVKSSITAHWKKLYIEAWSRGDTEERKRIIAILTETGLYGTRNDVATLAQNWVKNSK